MTTDASSSTPTTVVGYDGSPASLAAVELALDRLPPGGRLLVVYGFDEPQEYRGQPFYEVMLADNTMAAREMMNGLPERVPAIAGVDWEPDVMHTKPADAILRAAEVNHATEIVLGSRARGRLAGLLGSVAYAVLAGATCPVVVIPQRALRAEQEHQQEAVPA